MNNQNGGRPDDGSLSVAIRVLLPDEHRAAVALLAHSMRDNPLHVRVFGDNPHVRETRLLRFFGSLVAFVMRRGTVLGAYADGDLIGVLGMMEPGRCRPGSMDVLRLACAILIGHPPNIALRICRWLMAWARNDPAHPHWHIGPLAVLPGSRRRGVGRRLMTECCHRVDVLSATAYLETDLAINVAFYETLGFVVTRHAPVLGVPNWFMHRLPIR